MAQIGDNHPSACHVLGNGDLPLRITAIHQLTSRIRSYELRHAQDYDLPLIAAGAHLQVPIFLRGADLTSEKIELRSYSICSNPAQREMYEIAVLCDELGGGTAKSLQDSYHLGLQLNCTPPMNQFQLHADTSPAILIAGGIGIGPLKSIAHTLASRGRRFQLHYSGRSLKEMAFSEYLAYEFSHHLTVYPADENKRLNIMHLLESAANNALFYVCGPRTLIDEVDDCAARLAIAKDRIQSEYFSAAEKTTDKPIIVELARSNKLLFVTSEQTVLSAVRDAGVMVNFNCCVGDCGSCAVQVLEGKAEHRDHVLSDKDRSNGMMCICVSRAKSDKLILDL